jgi:hypothetical protein
MSSTDERARDPQLKWMNWPCYILSSRTIIAGARKASLCASGQPHRLSAQEIIRESGNPARNVVLGLTFFSWKRNG